MDKRMLISAVIASTLFLSGASGARGEKIEYSSMPAASCQSVTLAPETADPQMSRPTEPEHTDVLTLPMYVSTGATPKKDIMTVEERSRLPLSDGQFDKLFAEAKKYLGYSYTWGGSSPKTSFDCSGYISWVVNHSGIGISIGRTNSKNIYNMCEKLDASELAPGDLVFFKNTYPTKGVSHVGIYIGGGRMIHCGERGVRYADITDSYWRSHLYAYGRLPK